MISSVAVYGVAPIGTDKSGAIAPFNEYGRTKYRAEEMCRHWYNEEPDKRTLFIVGPTVLFDEEKRWSVYNLLRQIASGRFIIIGNGNNVNYIAYIENVVGFH